MACMRRGVTGGRDRVRMRLRRRQLVLVQRPSDRTVHASMRGGRVLRRLHLADRGVSPTTSRYTVPNSHRPGDSAT